MARKSPTPVRFDGRVAQRLVSFASSRPGLSVSGAANLLVDEALRMIEHPGIVFRDGPTGRRAGVAGGPDVWELIAAVKQARAIESELDDEEVLAVVVDNTGAPLRMVRTALNYWASHSDDIDAEIAAASLAETNAELAWRNQRDLLAR